MPEKKTAILNISKALAEIPLAALAIGGGATGIPWLAALLAIPSATLAASGTIGSQVAKLKSQKGELEQLEIPAPSWWNSDTRSWQNVCAEIVDHLPAIFQNMWEPMRKDERVKTMDVVQQVFVDTLTAQHLTWAPDSDERRKIGEVVALPILQKFGEALSLVIDQIQREDALQDQHKIAKHTQEIVMLMKKIPGVEKTPALGDEEVNSLRHQYCDLLNKYWSMLDFKGIMHVDMARPISIPLVDIFVMPDCIVGVPEYETLEREVMDAGIAVKGEKPGRYREADEQEYIVYQGQVARRETWITLQREDIRTVLAKHRRLVILGDPGSGKSALLRYLLLRLVQGKDEFIAEFPQLAEARSYVPLYIPLAEYDELRHSKDIGTRSLEDFLPGYLRENYFNPYIGFLQNQLQYGAVYLLFDGLDEILDPAQRLRVVQQIERFTQAHPGNRFIVTSRIVGYKEAPIAAEYQAYTLADFSEEQISLFTKRWCPAYERWVKATETSTLIEKEATKEAEKLFQATQDKPAVKKLAVNPLFLTILALIQRQSRDLPGHRIELFDLCARTLVETWVKTRRQSKLFSKSELNKMLRPLAFWMHEYTSVGAFPEEELKEQIVKQLLDRKISRDEVDAIKVSEQFLLTVRGETGILVERGKNRYGFLHQTFEEYFAARELVLRKDRDNFIKTHLHDSRWQEVILLTAGAVGILQENEEGVTELIQKSILRAGSPFNSWLHRDLLLAGVCLSDDVGVSIACEEEIIENIVYLYLTSPYDSLRDLFSSVLAAWSGTRAAAKAVSLILLLFRKREMIAQTMIARASTSFSPVTQFEEKLSAYYQKLVEQHLKSQIKLVYLQLVMIVRHLQIEVPDQVTDVLSMLSDADSDVRKAAVGALSQLGQLDSWRPQVIAALLQRLSDRSKSVREATITALGQLRSGQPKVIAALLSMLSDATPEVRKAAVGALGQLGNEQTEVVAALLQRLSDPAPAVREATITALGQLGNGQSEVVAALLQRLSDLAPDVRKAAASALGQLGTGQPEVVAALLQRLSDRSIHVRRAAACALGLFGSEQPDILAALLQAQSNWQVQRVVYDALGQLGRRKPHILSTLLQGLADSYWQVRQAAASALGQLGTGQPEVVAALLQALSDPIPDVGQAAASALGQLGTGQPEVIAALLQALSGSHWQVKRAAASSLGQLGTGQPEVVSALLQAISDAALGVGEAAITALGQLGSGQPEVINALLQVFSEDSLSKRQAAITALGQLGSGQPEVIAALLQRLSDRSIAVQRISIRSLGQLGRGQPEVVDALLQELSDANPDIRQSAAIALGAFVSDQPKVLSALLEMLSDSTSDVQRAAITALSQLDNGQPGVVDRLLQSLSDSDSGVREAAASALVQLGREQSQIVGYLLTVLSSIDSACLTQTSIDEYIQSLYIASTLRQLRLLEQIANKQQPEVVTALFQGLSDSSVSVRRVSIRTLGQLGNNQPEVVSAFLQELSNTTPGVREAAASALGQLGNSQPEVVTALLQRLSDSSRQVQRAVITALGQLGNGQPEVVDALLQRLSVPSRRIQRAAASALGQLASRQSGVVTALLQRLSDPVPKVRQAAASAFGQLGSGRPDVVAALLQVLSDSNSDVRQAVASALGQLGSGQPEVVAALLRRLSDSSISVRRAVASALGQLGTGQPEVVAALLQAHSDSYFNVRRAVVSALGQLGSGQPVVVAVLLQRLSDSSGQVRRAAASALGQLGSRQPEVVTALFQALSDSVAGVRQAAVRALDQLGSSKSGVLTALLNALSDPARRVRRAAVRALGQLGSGRPDVLAALLGALTDADPAIRQAAASALTTLRIDRELVASRIEELLRIDTDNTGNQFAANDITDTLLLALQQIVGIV